MLGKEAHGEGCLCRARDKQSRHGLGHRFKDPEDVQERNDARDAANKLKRETKNADLGESLEAKQGKKVKTEPFKAEGGLSTPVKLESSIVKKEPGIKTEDE